MIAPELHRIFDGAVQHARSRDAVVVDVPHLALSVTDLASEAGIPGVVAKLSDAAVAADGLARRVPERDMEWAPGVVPVSTGVRRWMRSMESATEITDQADLLAQAAERILELFVPPHDTKARRTQRAATARKGGTSGSHPPYVVEFTNELLERFDPYIGNDRLVNLTLGVLARQRKRNPVFVGPAGVGKTALALEIARRVNRGDVPPVLVGARVFQVDLGDAVAGTRYRGDFEERISWMAKRLLDDPKSIFFIDEVHLVLTVGSGEGGIDAASLLKPALSTGVGAVIGATTADQAHRLERDAALARRLVFIPVDEPSLGHARQILAAHARSLEGEFGVRIPDETVEAALEAGAGLRPKRHLPDSALDILDLATSLAVVEEPGSPTIRPDAVARVVDFVSEGLSSGTRPTWLDEGLRKAREWLSRLGR